MLVTIAGCGALGSLLAAHMIRGGLQVQVFQRKGKTMEALKSRGITLMSEEAGKSRSFPLAAIADKAEKLSPSKLILVLVKSYSTPEIFPLKQILDTDGVVLTIQNGLGNAEILADIFGEERIAAGITTYGSVSLSPGVVKEGLKGSIAFGPFWKGRKTDMTWITDVLQNAGLRIDHVNDPRSLIWKKLVMNVMANPIFALTRMSPPEIYRSDLLLELMEKIGSEAIQAGKRAGVDLEFDQIWTFFMENLKKAPSHKPSMLQDMEAGRKMEIDSIAGGVLKYARDENDFPYIRTMYSLLKAIDMNRGNI